MSRRSRRLILASLLVIHAMMLGYGAWIHSPGWDEVGHLPAGVSYWQLGNTDLYRVNPPFVRAIATLPLTLLDIDMDWRWAPDDTLSRPEFDMGRQLWERYGRDAYHFLTWARWACIPFSLCAAGVIYLWSNDLYGPTAGLLSAALWCFSPLVLANAQMITPDTGAAALGAGACYLFWKWLDEPAWDFAVAAGFALGLAQLTKFTWVILFVLWPSLWLLRRVVARNDSSGGGIRNEGGQFAVSMVLAVFVINLGYGFEGAFQQLGEYRFVSGTLAGNELPDGRHHPRTDNRFEDTWLAAVPVPVPDNYVLGIDRQKLDFERGFDSYLRGRWRDHGWWYYYLYGLGVKEPVGFLALLGLTLGISFSNRWQWRDELILLAPSVLILALVSSQTGFNHHVRYLLPAFPFVFVWMGKLWDQQRVSRRWRFSAAALLVLGIAPSLWVFPHSHAFFNGLVGGPLRGHDHLLDSNIDWGQDLLPLSRWLKAHPQVELDGVAYSLDHLLPLEDFGIPESEPPRGWDFSKEEPLPTGDERNQVGPQPGWWAVFVRPLRESHGHYDYFRQFEPVAIVGYTVYIYRLTPGDVERYWERAVLVE